MPVNPRLSISKEEGKAVWFGLFSDHIQMGIIIFSVGLIFLYFECVESDYLKLLTGYGMASFCLNMHLTVWVLTQMQRIAFIVRPWTIFSFYQFC